VAWVRSKRRRRLRSHRLLAASIAAAVIAVLAGGTDLAYTSVKSSADQLQAKLTGYLQAGQAELEAGKGSLELANKDHNADSATTAIVHFAAAKEKFLAAANLADHSQLLKQLELVPSVGEIARSRHGAVRGISAMGIAASEAGQDLAALDAELIKPSAAGPAGRTMLTVLDQTQVGLAKVRADFGRAQKAAAQVDSRVVPIGQLRTFLKARDTIAAAVAGLDEFERLVPVLVEVLGGNGPRTYLVEQVNPIELRAGGGFIGGYTLLRADHGALTVIGSGNSYDLADPRPSPWQAGFIPQPSPLREVIPQVSWSFVDSNVFPDFPSNAKAAESFVQPRIKTEVNGVLAMDYYTVSKMLEFTGPLGIPGFGLSVDSSNFIPLVTQLDYANDPIHKAILSALSGPLMERVSALPPERWPALLTALNGLAAERHLQAYFNNGSVENEIDRVGWSGAFKLQGYQDYMFEVESNYGSKANHFLRRWYAVDLTRNGSTLHHKVTVEFVNNTPGGSYARTYYHADVRLYVGDTASSTSTNLTPVKYANPSPPAGAKLLGGWLLVDCCGGRGRAVFEYDTPWPANGKGYQIYWQKQPGTVTDKVDLTWSDGNGHFSTVSGDLGQDRVITLTPTGVTLWPGHPAQATLPSLSLG
jgi:hypothetical protein